MNVITIKLIGRHVITPRLYYNGKKLKQDYVGKRFALDKVMNGEASFSIRKCSLYPNYEVKVKNYAYSIASIAERKNVSRDMIRKIMTQLELV